MDEIIAIKLVDKDYFVPIYFDGIEYHSVDNLKLEKNGIPNSNGQLVYTMGKNINVPLFICDEFHQYGITDTHLGINGHKKISDLLIDNKVDGFTKDKQLVLTANDEIIWVCGRSISDQVKVTNKTTNFLELSFTKTYNNAS